MSLLDQLPDFNPREPLPPKPEAQRDPLVAIVSLSDELATKMAHYYDNPGQRPRGLTTHIDELDAHFKWMPGYTNLFTGWPGSGKSEFVRQLLLLDAVHGDKKSLLFAPEDMPEDAWYDALIHSLTGQTPDSEIPGHLPRRYYMRAMEWAREYFFLVHPKRYGGKTPRHILDIFEAARAKLGTTHHVLDPWNKADHSGMNAAGGWQPYLVAEVGAMTDWSLETGACLTLIAHPAKKPRLRGEAREVPDSDGVSGGQTWDDMMHTVSAVYRPNVHTQRNDPAVAYYSHKLKSHRRIGAKPGSIGQGSENEDVLISFDWKSARYSFNGAAPLDSPLAYSLYGDPMQVAAPVVATTARGFRTHQDFQNEFVTP